jgi:hypothetical protein
MDGDKEQTTMRSLILVAALLLSTAAQAESVSLTVQQTRELYVALSSLDGYDKVVKDGASEKVVKTPYAFGGGLRLAIGRNLLAVSPTVQAYDKANPRTLHSVSNGKDKLEGEGLVKFQAEAQKMQDAKATLTSSR